MVSIQGKVLSALLVEHVLVLSNCYGTIAHAGCHAPLPRITTDTPRAVPIAYVEAETILSGTLHFGRQTMLLLNSKGIAGQRGDSDNQLVLTAGSILFAPENKIEVVLPHMRVELDPGSIVYIRQTDTSAAILNLHDEHSNSVLIHTSKKSNYLKPGHVLVLTSKEEDVDFEQSNPCPGLWFRTIYKSRQDDGITIFVTQFSTLSAAWISPTIRHYCSNPKNGGKLSKTAAAVYAVTKDHKEFRYTLEAYERVPVLHVFAKLTSKTDGESTRLEEWKTAVQGTSRGDDLIGMLDGANDKLSRGVVDKETYFLRGYLYGTVGCTNWAIRDLSKAIEMDSHFTRAYTERAICHMDKQNYQDALKDLDWALKLDPNSGDALLARGRLHLMANEPAAALADLLKCATEPVEFKPVLPGEVPANYFNAPDYYLGACYKALGKEDQSLPFYNKAASAKNKTMLASEYLHRYADKPLNY